jgi:hypothetical protein
MNGMTLHRIVAVVVYMGMHAWKCAEKMTT